MNFIFQNLTYPYSGCRGCEHYVYRMLRLPMSQHIYNLGNRFIGCGSCRHLQNLKLRFTSPKIIGTRKVVAKVADTMCSGCRGCQHHITSTKSATVVLIEEFADMMFIIHKIHIHGEILDPSSHRYPCTCRRGCKHYNYRLPRL